MLLGKSIILGDVGLDPLVASAFRQRSAVILTRPHIATPLVGAAVRGDQRLYPWASAIQQQQQQQQQRYYNSKSKKQQRQQQVFYIEAQKQQSRHYHDGEDGSEHRTDIGTEQQRIAWSARPHRLLEWSELPKWQQEDSVLETGYRPVTPSLLQCLRSWLYFHNETVSLVNIFSHLVGAVLFFAFLPWLLYRELGQQRYATASTGDVVVLGAYLAGVATCFGLSALFHTLTSHSAAALAFGVQLDFQGIILLMWSTTAPMVYYTFYTEPHLQLVYWSLSSFFAVLASISTFTPAFRKPATAPLRVAVFGALALSTLACVAHGALRHGWQVQNERLPMSCLALTMLFNALGALVYVLRFPERCWPRTFDCCGASHQLMHCAIIVASLFLLCAYVRAFDNAHALRALPAPIAPARC